VRNKGSMGDSATGDEGGSIHGRLAVVGDEVAHGRKGTRGRGGCGAHAGGRARTSSVGGEPLVVGDGCQCRARRTAEEGRAPAGHDGDCGVGLEEAGDGCRGVGDGAAVHR
jgi:hypothetical protein